MSANIYFWFVVANVLILIAAVVFLFAGLFLGRRKKPRMSYPPLPKGPIPTPEEFTELCNWFEETKRK